MEEQCPIIKCVSGLTELNTFFMIARRCWQSQRALMHRLYWLTYVPLRRDSFPLQFPLLPLKKSSPALPIHQQTQNSWPPLHRQDLFIDKSYAPMWLCIMKDEIAENVPVQADTISCSSATFLVCAARISYVGTRGCCCMPVSTFVLLTVCVLSLPICFPFPPRKGIAMSWCWDYIGACYISMPAIWIPL